MGVCPHLQYLPREQTQPDPLGIYPGPPVPWGTCLGRSWSWAHPSSLLWEASWPRPVNSRCSLVHRPWPGGVQPCSGLSSSFPGVRGDRGPSTWAVAPWWAKGVSEGPRECEHRPASRLLWQGQACAPQDPESCPGCWSTTPEPSWPAPLLRRVGFRPAGPPP